VKRRLFCPEKNMTCCFIFFPILTLRLQKNPLQNICGAITWILRTRWIWVYSHIKNLRRNILEKNGKDYIQSIYGIGYKFTAF